VLPHLRRTDGAACATVAGVEKKAAAACENTQVALSNDAAINQEIANQDSHQDNNCAWPRSSSQIEMQRKHRGQVRSVPDTTGVDSGSGPKLIKFL
jgi:hypothetical protein